MRSGTEQSTPHRTFNNLSRYVNLMFPWRNKLNLSPPNVAYMRQWIGSALVLG